MPRHAVSSVLQPDENGWIEGTPTVEGSYWFCTKDNKYNDWRIYIGSTFEYRGQFCHALTGYGTARSTSLRDCYYQPASIPELPVATLKKRSKETSTA